MRSRYIIAGLLLVALAVVQAVAISSKTLTNDELVHIPAGYYYWTTGDFRFNAEHPPLVKMWASLPLLLLSRTDALPPDAGVPQQRWEFYGLFWQQRAVDFVRFAFWPRIMMIPIVLALGVVIFLYAKKLFGVTAALFALALYCVEPTMLAHGRMVHTDVAGALSFLGFFYLLHRYREKRSLPRAAWLALGTAAALLTKFSMVIAGVVLGATLLGELVKARGKERGAAAGRLVAAALLILVLINAVYFFQHPALNETDLSIIKGQQQFAITMARAIPVLRHVLPTYFLFGMYNVMAHNEYGHATSLLGMQSTMGWWYYFPVAFALKTTIPFLLLSIAALLWGIYNAIRGRSLAHQVLLVPIGVYCAISLTSHINIGVRHFLPVFPFLMILAGGLLESLTRGRRKVGVAVAVAALGWCSVEAVRAFPHYTAYVNEFARGGGWRYLSDSNVEWGDDAQDLAVYLKARGVTTARCALLGGWMTMGYLGIQCPDLYGPDGPVPESGYAAIGASFLNGSTVPTGEPGTLRGSEELRVNYFAPYRNRQPEAILGGSIYLYKLP
jgi:hypothetical protein